MIGFALVLLLGAAAGWIAAQGARPRARAYLRLGAVLYGAMAISQAFGVAPPAVRDIVMILGSSVLCIAAYSAFKNKPRFLSASVMLAASAAAGIAAATLGQSVLAAVPQVVSALFMLLIARRFVFAGNRSGLYLALSALCLVGAAACGLAPVANLMARAGLLVFAAAAVAGVALASNLLVEERGAKRRHLAVSRAR
ncbi:MAG: hypothetical protein P4L57_07970 [Rhizomicrobium sp.]|nr:hypothetical protein [Rhizomicrobium sp.]